jgi:hypothetical protein
MPARSGSSRRTDPAAPSYAGRQATTRWLDRFTGYSDTVNPGDKSKLTSDCSNAKFRFGRIYGRGGMSKFAAISTSSSSAACALFNYRRTTNTHQLLRLLTSSNVIQVWDGSTTWTDVTGAALANGNTCMPQYTIIDDVLIFTNEGKNRIRKYPGTGNTEEIAGGIPPYCKGVVAYLGYLFAFNISDDGSFADVFDGARTGRYADSWDDPNAWTPCDGNQIILDETPGNWMATAVLGRQMFALKTDGVIAIKFVGGQQRFTQAGVPSDVGIMAPLSLGIVGNDPGSASHAFFLGNDGIIYQINQEGVQAVSYETLFSLIPDAMNFKMRWARGLIDSEEDTYYLFYDRTSLSGMYFNSYVSFNYRTGEWSKGNMAQHICVTAFKGYDQDKEKLLIANNLVVRVFDDTSIDDDGTAINRYWTTGWHKIDEEGWLHRVRLVFARSNGAKVAVSLAIGYGEEFGDEQILQLQGAKSSQTHVEVIYQLASPVLVDWVNIKIRFLHLTTSAVTRLEKIGLEVSSLLKTSEVLPKGEQI